MKCNGWKNRQTWNVALWIGNDEGLYRLAVEYMAEHPKTRFPYRRFIKDMGLESDKTPDGYKWISHALDYDALDEMMKEMATST